VLSQCHFFPMGVRTFLVFFLVFSINTVWATVQKPNLLDTAIVSGYLKLAKEKLKNGDLNEVAISLKKASVFKDTSSIQQYNFNYLNLYRKLLNRRGSHQEAFQLAKRLMAISIQTKNKFQSAEAYQAMAEQQRAVGKLQLATENIIKAITIAEKYGFKRSQAEYYYFLANIFFELREPKKLLFYSNKGYQLALQLKDSTLIARSLLNISIDEMLNDQTDLALRHLREIEPIFSRNKEMNFLATTYLFLGHVYYRQKKYELALVNLNKIEPLYAKVQNGKSIQLHTEGALMETYLKLGEYDKAKFYFDKNLQQAVKEMDAEDVREFYLLGSEIYEHKGEYRKSLSLLKQHKLMTDSVNNLVMKKAIHETEIKYQTTIKEKALSDQKLQLIHKDFELQKKNKYILYGIAAIVLLLLGSVIIYLIYRNKNQAIELSLLKAQIHPHFLFNTLNNLYALTITKADEAPDVVLGLSSILRYILYECNTLNVDLKKEMHIISAYISLEKIRYTQNLEVNMDVKQDFGDIQIAPLLILPLVENAFKHGVEKLINEAWINMEAYIKGNTFVFKISNNKPLEMENEKSTAKYGNIGLPNIKKRLNILYPKRHKFKITNIEDVFIVTMELTISN